MTIFERLERVGAVRPLVLVFLLYMTYDTYQWAAQFAETSSRGGMEVTAIIAAVIAPLSFLQGWVAKLYNDACNHKE